MGQQCRCWLTSSTFNWVLSYLSSWLYFKADFSLRSLSLAVGVRRASNSLFFEQCNNENVKQLTFKPHILWKKICVLYLLLQSQLAIQTNPRDTCLTVDRFIAHRSRLINGCRWPWRYHTLFIPCTIDYTTVSETAGLRHGVVLLQCRQNRV